MNRLVRSTAGRGDRTRGDGGPMRTRAVVLAVAVVAAALLTAAPGAARAADGDGACTGPQLCVGAAEVDVAPQAPYVRGVVEPRLLVAPHLQRFNLGGFGINP